MQKQTLSQLLSQSLFEIPSYQRGYAWEEKQWREFIQDLDALVEDDVSSHYTGTVVTFQKKDNRVVPYHLSRLKSVDVVDGQQRLTTSTLYLSIVISMLINAGADEFEAAIPTYLYSSVSTRLKLNNDTQELFYDLIRWGSAKTVATSTHQLRLAAAHQYLMKHVSQRFAAKGNAGVDYLRGLFEALTQKLVFTFYTIEFESEIGMTFELMNSRGKGLSVLELLKNYVMHWVYRNVPEEKREGLTQMINRNWKDAYTNIGRTDGRGGEDQCLRIAWTLYCNHTPKNWDGYEGFKDDAYIPLRNFFDPEKPEHANFKTKEATQEFLERFSDGLSLVSKHYSRIVCPRMPECVSEEEFKWLTKIHHTGNIANFLPLMTAARIRVENGKVTEAEYIELLKALECYAYRVFLFEGMRSNSGKSSFHRWADEVFRGAHALSAITPWIYGLMDNYSAVETFDLWNSKPENWYVHRGLLRYTLFEYELHLVETEGKGKPLTIQWGDIMTDTSIEHILPQNPDTGSDWLLKWTAEEMKLYLHDLGNLVLTQNNSNYKNFDFERKRGVAGKSPSYIHSDIRQERDVAGFDDWTPAHLLTRRSSISDWIKGRWRSLNAVITAMPADQDDDDAPIAVN